MTLPISPLAPEAFPHLPEIKGVRFAVAQAAVKYEGRNDVMLAVGDPGSSIAGVFTKSSTRSAAVMDCEKKLASALDPTEGLAIIVNSGNANAFTGRAGEDAVVAISASAAEALSISKKRVFTASTGVIGERLPYERITSRMEDLAKGLSASGISLAAEAIKTTDTFPKGAGKQIEIGGKSVSIAGIAKGSGMIAPDLATMLAYIFTDASIAQPALQKILHELAEDSFNAITVDGDTSTSDSVMLVATGASGVDAAEDLLFREALREVMLDLAKQIVCDGEGASKLISVAVNGADSKADAKRVAMSIANSPLVKTAIAGEDANWGRIVMAVGKSGAKADRDRLSIRFGEIEVARDGVVSPDYSEEEASAYMKRDEIQISVELGLGNASFTAWSCDLTHGYISINADYRS